MVTYHLIVSLQPNHSAPSSRLSESLPVTKSPDVHPLSIQQVTKCPSRNSFVLKMIPFNGGVPSCLPSLHDRDSLVLISHPLSPIPFLFTFLHTLLHSRKNQLLCFQVFPHSFAKTPGVAYPLHLLPGKRSPLVPAQPSADLPASFLPAPPYTR